MRPDDGSLEWHEEKQRRKQKEANGNWYNNPYVIEKTPDEWFDAIANPNAVMRGDRTPMEAEIVETMRGLMDEDDLRKRREAQARAEVEFHNRRRQQERWLEVEADKARDRLRGQVQLDAARNRPIIIDDIENTYLGKPAKYDYTRIWDTKAGTIGTGQAEEKEYTTENGAVYTNAKKIDEEKTVRTTKGIMNYLRDTLETKKRKK